MLVGLLLSPLLLLLARDLVGRFVNGPYSLCQLRSPSELESAIAQGLQINAGCCSETMMWECSIAKPNSSELIYAIEAGQMDSVQALLDRGADVNMRRDMGDALQMAIWHGRTEMIDPILDHGPNPASLPAAVLAAAREGHPEIAARIFSRIPSERLAETCRRYLCALSTELIQRRPQVAALRAYAIDMIRACPDPNLMCETERLVTSIARKEENAPLVKALLDKGADLNAPEKNGLPIREYLKRFNDYGARPQIKALLEGTR